MVAVAEVWCLSVKIWKLDFVERAEFKANCQLELSIQFSVSNLHIR